jgi:hypothetical protein
MLILNTEDSNINPYTYHSAKHYKALKVECWKKKTKQKTNTKKSGEYIKITFDLSNENVVKNLAISVRLDSLKKKKESERKYNHLIYNYINMYKNNSQ